MPSMNKSISLAGGGSSMSKSVVRTSDGADAREVALPTGKVGTLSTRTDNTSGTFTMNAGHGLTTGQVVDFYWNGGRRYGVTLGTVSGNSVPFSGGAGPNNPIATTAVVVTPQVQINAQIDGDMCTVIGCSLEYASPSSTAVGHADFQDGSNTTVTQQDFVANSPRLWDITGGDTNAFTGNIIQRVMASNGSSTEAATLKIIWGTDSTP